MNKRNFQSNSLKQWNMKNCRLIFWFIRIKLKMSCLNVSLPFIQRWRFEVSFKENCSSKLINLTNNFWICVSIWEKIHKVWKRNFTVQPKNKNFLKINLYSQLQNTISQPIVVFFLQKVHENCLYPLPPLVS